MASTCVILILLLLLLLRLPSRERSWARLFVISLVVCLAPIAFAPLLPPEEMLDTTFYMPTLFSRLQAGIQAGSRCDDPKLQQETAGAAPH